MGSRMATKGYRKSVDIPDDAACRAFAALPAQLFTSPSTFYTNRVFKNAPSWSKGVRLIPALNEIVEASNGLGVHQKSARQQFKV